MQRVINFRTFYLKHVDLESLQVRVTLESNVWVLDQENSDDDRRATPCWGIPQACDGWYKRRHDDCEMYFGTNGAPRAKPTLWMFQSETERVGGIPSLGVPDAATCYGYPIHPDVADAFHVLVSSEKATAAARHEDPPLYAPMMVVYHGTDGKNVESIVRDGIIPSYDGMLGPGVYVGTFWKGARFATRDQQWHPRPSGAVFRVAVRADTVIQLTYDTPCECFRCKTLPEPQLADHGGAWRRRWGVEGLWLPVTEAATRKRDGSTRFIVKNAEGVVRHDRVWALDWAPVVDPAVTPTSNYDPTSRTARADFEAER